ncbi:hypothetical protein CALCODRAFT_479376 [Calocera cornea HHB12733]|uniref:Uncharacterized protein n=1 Tax=Calocera cornea HHB12733 TaxID=1353952 RepID=A0A165JRR8_9BASI|nr:hypothetical protein CALCODRAFT_479376 [Calocera cornea HHB12733]
MATGGKQLTGAARRASEKKADRLAKEAKAAREVTEAADGDAASQTGSAVGLKDSEEEVDASAEKDAIDEDHDPNWEDAADETTSPGGIAEDVVEDIVEDTDGEELEQPSTPPKATKLSDATWRKKGGHTPKRKEHVDVDVDGDDGPDDGVEDGRASADTTGGSVQVVEPEATVDVAMAILAPSPELGNIKTAPSKASSKVVSTASSTTLVTTPKHVQIIEEEVTDMEELKEHYDTKALDRLLATMPKEEDELVKWANMPGNIKPFRVALVKVVRRDPVAFLFVPMSVARYMGFWFRKKWKEMNCVGPLRNELDLPLGAPLHSPFEEWVPGSDERTKDAIEDDLMPYSRWALLKLDIAARNRKPLRTAEDMEDNELDLKQIKRERAAFEALDKQGQKKWCEEHTPEARKAALKALSVKKSGARGPSDSKASDALKTSNCSAASRVKKTVDTISTAPKALLSSVEPPSKSTVSKSTAGVRDSLKGTPEASGSKAPPKATVAKKPAGPCGMCTNKKHICTGGWNRTNKSTEGFEKPDGVACLSCRVCGLKCSFASKNKGRPKADKRARDETDQEPEPPAKKLVEDSEASRVVTASVGSGYQGTTVPYRTYELPEHAWATEESPLFITYLSDLETVLHRLSEEFARMHVMNAIAEDNLKVIRQAVTASDDPKSEQIHILVTPVSGKELQPKRHYRVVTGAIYEAASEVIEINDDDDNDNEVLASKAKSKGKGKQGEGLSFDRFDGLRIRCIYVLFFVFGDIRSDSSVIKTFDVAFDNFLYRCHALVESVSVIGIIEVSKHRFDRSRKVFPA